MTTEATNPGLAAFDAMMRGRYSCRAFRPEPVPLPLIEAILTTAQRSASWSNTQPWWLHVVSGAALDTIREEMTARALSGARAEPEIAWPREIRGAHRDRRRECGWGLYEAVGIEKGDRAASARQAVQNFRFFEAPLLVLLTCDEALGTYGVMDCGAWVQSFLLAAAAAGIDSVAQAAVASYPDIWRAHLKIPEERCIICGIAVGHADPDHPANAFRTTRAPISEVVAWVD